MSENLDTLLGDDSSKWIAALPNYQSEPIQSMLSSGISLEQAAQNWLTATADSTFHFAAKPAQPNTTFLENLRSEMRDFLCGNPKYKKERDEIFGKKGLTQIYVVSCMASAIAPFINVAAPVIAPAIAILLAAMGKVTINAWCKTQPPSDSTTGKTQSKT